MEDRAVFGDVDFLAAEHGINSAAQIGFVGELYEKLQGFVGDAVFGIVQIEPGRFRDKPLATRWIGGKQLAQVPALDLPAMLHERPPLRALGQRLRFRKSGIAHVSPHFSPDPSR